MKIRFENLDEGILVMTSEGPSEDKLLLQLSERRRILTFREVEGKSEVVVQLPMREEVRRFD